jgi:hypothetical protein
MEENFDLRLILKRNIIQCLSTATITTKKSFKLSEKRPKLGIVDFNSFYFVSFQ